MHPLPAATAASPQILPARRALGLGAAFVACYVFLDWATYIYPIRPFAITPWNPPAGLGLALLLVYGLRWWPALAAAVLLADVLVRGIPPLPVFGPLAAGVLTVGYVALAAALRGPLGFRSELEHVRDVAMLAVASALGTLLIAVAYVSIFRVGDTLPSYQYLPAVIRFWIGDLIGVLTTTPLLLVLRNQPGLRLALQQRPWPWTEMALQLCAIILTLWVIFGFHWVDQYTLFYLLFLPLIWITMRHAILGAALSITAIQFGLIVTVQFSGYLAAAVLEFQFLMLALASTGLFLGVVLTERRAARHALNQSESRLRAIVSTAPDAIVTVDRAGTIVAANPAAARIFGFEANALVGASVHDVLPEFERVARLEEVSEASGVRRDGTRFPVELAVGATGTQAPDLRIAIARDVTRRREIERQLGDKQAELNRAGRLAAAGEMAAALAHELHQPLSAIRNYARAARLLPAPLQADELLGKVEREAARAATIVQRLRDFFRGGASRLECVNVGRLVDEALAPMRDEAMQQHVALEIALPARQVELLVDRVQIQTVLHILVANALEAIAAGANGARRIEITAAAAGEGWLRLSVADSGAGVSPAIADRLFEPFATTKSTGIGLGLALSRSMVEAHGGKLWAEAGAGGGAVFHLTLPRADARETLDADR